MAAVRMASFSTCDWRHSWPVRALAGVDRLTVGGGSGAKRSTDDGRAGILSVEVANALQRKLQPLGVAESACLCTVLP